MSHKKGAARARLSFNIVNEQDIKNYLQNIVNQDKPDKKLAELLILAMEKPLKKFKGNLSLINTLPDESPEWLKKKWDDAKEFYEFKPTQSLDVIVCRIRDWLKNEIRSQAVWLENTDEQGRPLKLLKIGSIDDALNVVAKDMEVKRNKMQGANLDDFVAFEDELLGGDIQPVMIFPDGFRFVQLVTSKALDRETNLMGHCIGNGYYDDYLLSSNPRSNVAFYSLRDSKNCPHVTIEADFTNKTFLQGKGKNNKPPVSKYFEYIKSFVQRTGYDLGYVGARMGLVMVNKKFYELHNLPDNFEFTGSMDITGFYNFKFPKNLTIKAALVLREEQMEILPECLTVQGRVQVFYSNDDNQVTEVKTFQSLGGKLRKQVWYNSYGYHRDNAPALVEYSPQKDIIIHEVWYQNGHIHRGDGGPAVVTRCSQSGRVLGQAYWLHGKKQEGPPDKQAA